jgi:hypothetical protein
MEHTGNLATVWGACATEKGRQFRQMSMDLSEFFPMIFCIERVSRGNGNVTGHKVKKDPSVTIFTQRNDSHFLVFHKYAFSAWERPPICWALKI